MKIENILWLTLVGFSTCADDLKSSESHLSHLGHGGLPPPPLDPFNPATAAQLQLLQQLRGGSPVVPPYAPPSYSPYSALTRGGGYSGESTVHRNPYETHNALDAIRTQDADLAPNNPYNNPYLAPHAAAQLLGVGGLNPLALQGGLNPLGHQGSLHHGGGGYQPYRYDIGIIPECAYTNKHYYNLTFCLQDDYYPTETIEYELARNLPLVDRLLSDVTYQSADNLVDGLTKVDEEGYTYEHYYGNKHYQQYGSDYKGYSYAEDYYKGGGYICPSDIFYGRPKRAVNTYGKWKVIVNLPDEYNSKGKGNGYEKYEKYSQTQRLEQCMYPTAPCSFIDQKYYSQCLQKHNFVRLLCYTYEEGLHIDSFKLPVACSCHIGSPLQYNLGYGGHLGRPTYDSQGQVPYHPSSVPANLIGGI